LLLLLPVCIKGPSFIIEKTKGACANGLDC
jgi:hypothetical protein